MSNDRGTNMGIPTGGGPDLIFHQARDDITVPWSRPIATFVVGIWALFVIVPYIFADDPSLAMLIRWTVVALVALVLTFAIPALIVREHRRAVAGTVVAAGAIVALLWVFTA
jgi:VIT1/CCC1 family predicted Fe2+/Mn2+ transporter